MASITIRDLDEQTKARLRVRAAHQGRSMEDEVRNKRFEPLGGVDLELPTRERMREPPRPGK